MNDKKIKEDKKEIENITKVCGLGGLNEKGIKRLSEIEIKEKLEYLRGEILAERISYGEIAELQALAKYIDPSDAELLQWAGVKEK